MAVEDVPDPEIEAPTDAIVRITSAAICGSDLHMYAGRTAAEPGLVLGHEPLGVVERIGDEVETVEAGDRVVVPFNVSCGVCINCARGYTSACLNVNPAAAGGAYGYVGLGRFRGAQAQYLRVPFADSNCVKVPGRPGDDWEDDFVLLADVFPTGWFANELAHVGAESTVAVFGAGPVGLAAAHAASLRGASELYVVDYVPERLAKAEEFGARSIDMLRGDPVEQIAAARRRMGATDPRMSGVMCGIEAVGYQARDWSAPGNEDPTRALEDLIRVVNPTGAIAAVGLYVPYDPGGVNPHAKRGELKLSFGRLWEKSITLGTGQTPVLKYLPTLIELVASGRAKPGRIVTHHASLDEAPRFYDLLNRRAEGCIKVILRP